MKSIVIRAEGGRSIGMGHIMRTVILAKELRKYFYVFYIYKEDSNNNYLASREKILEEDFAVITVSEENFYNELKNINAYCLITDSYDVDEEYFNITKEYFSKTGYIDDLNLYNFNVDFIINQNINGTEHKYKTNENTKLFLGTKYLMVREEFRRSFTRKIKDIENILITTGGSDEKHLSLKLTERLLSTNYNLYVVLGSAFNENLKSSLRNLEKNNSNISIYENPSMSKLMINCDLAISACGSTLYELCLCKTPTLGLITAENQRAVGETMNKLGLIKIVENYNNILDYIDYISDIDIRNKIVKNMEKYFQSDGILRLVEEIKKILKD
ncbi:UDP-2,4-diacetamido-2,4,6-trideoxy-beta-L-altropyranose hydrolase [Clostridium sp. Marseille-Q7071]